MPLDHQPDGHLVLIGVDRGLGIMHVAQNLFSSSLVVLYRAGGFCCERLTVRSTVCGDPYKVLLFPCGKTVNENAEIIACNGNFAPQVSEVAVLAWCANGVAGGANGIPPGWVAVWNAARGQGMPNGIDLDQDLFDALAADFDEAGLPQLNEEEVNEADDLNDSGIVDD